MTNTLDTSQFQQALEVVEALSPEDQRLLLDILLKRLQQKRRKHLIREVQEIRQEMTEGAIQFGSVKDFLTELDA